MAHKRIVLVLGAGASRPYGFPTGKELVDRVINVPSADRQLLQLLVDLDAPQQLVTDFCGQVDDARPRSIDQFLEFNPRFQRVGKQLIAGILMHHEAPGALGSNEGAGQWYHYLWDRINPQSVDTLFADDRLSFITFNYDRSLEYWLLKRIRSAFGVTNEKAIEVLRRLTVTHIHGRIGGVLGIDETALEYGPPVTRNSIETAALGMKIISEAPDESQELQTARRQLLYADVVLFLGFGYNPHSVRRLRVTSNCCDRTEQQDWPILEHMQVAPGATLLGTTLGLTESERRVELRRAFGDAAIETHSLTVLEFLRNNAEHLDWGTDSER